MQHRPQQPRTARETSTCVRRAQSTETAMKGGDRPFAAMRRVLRSQLRGSGFPKRFSEKPLRVQSGRDLYEAPSMPLKRRMCHWYLGECPLGLCGLKSLTRASAGRHAMRQSLLLCGAGTKGGAMVRKWKPMPWRRGCTSPNWRRARGGAGGHPHPGLNRSAPTISTPPYPHDPMGPCRLHGAHLEPVGPALPPADASWDVCWSYCSIQGSFPPLYSPLAELARRKG